MSHTPCPIVTVFYLFSRTPRTTAPNLPNSLPARFPSVYSKLKTPILPYPTPYPIFLITGNIAFSLLQHLLIRRTIFYGLHFRQNPYPICLSANPTIFTPNPPPNPPTISLEPLLQRGLEPIKWVNVKRKSNVSWVPVKPGVLCQSVKRKASSFNLGSC